MGPAFTKAAFIGSTVLKAGAQMRAGRAEQRMYDAKASDALMKGRSEAIAYKNQGAAVLRNLNENLAAIIARSSAGNVSATSGSAATIALFGQAEAAREYHASLDNAVMAEGQAEVQADQYRLAGQEAVKTAQINAFSTILGGAFKYGQL